MGTSNAAGVDRHNVAILPKEADLEVPDEKEGVENLNTAKSIS